MDEDDRIRILKFVFNAIIVYSKNKKIYRNQKKEEVNKFLDSHTD
ncbi:hypothetical protein OIU78_025321 [Salix suchowensis]|nr:hypothetical protein OIU78_025321 [Salix suchowensis]